MSWRLVRLHPPCADCVLADDFEGPTNGSEVFPNGVTGVKRNVKLRVRPYLGEYTLVLLIVAEGRYSRVKQLPVPLFLRKTLTSDNCKNGCLVSNWF